MNHKIYAFVLIILLTAFSAVGISAQPFEITQSNTSNSGGGTSSGGMFQVKGAIGQPSAASFHTGYDFIHIAR